jgi:RHS repeat-associated protein
VQACRSANAPDRGRPRSFKVRTSAGNEASWRTASSPGGLDPGGGLRDHCATLIAFGLLILATALKVISRFPGNPVGLATSVTRVIITAINNAWTRANNAAGLPTSVTDPLGHAVHMGYQQADLSSITDAVGRTVSFFPDGVGRVEVIADPLGNRTQIAYDPLDRVTQVTNPLNGKTILTYDQNGNVLTVTDPRNAGQHSYAYDERNRLHTYTDPLGNVETYNYDGLGNLTSKVDRKGQTTAFLYDALNRLQTATYADASTVKVTWDAGNRPQTIVDSANGTITQTYDGLDRVTAEVSPQGQVSYQYDAAGRRTVLTTTVSGIAQSVNYYYDNANRLTQIKNGSTVLLGLGYDTANRRISITYPNGVVTTTGFDAANEILSLSYDHGATHIGDLAYTYDVGGRQSAESGSLAQFNTPAAVATMTYNAANRLTAIGSVIPTFDNNGNLLSNGAATYTWNARNQLIGTNAGSAVYNYDALGRRVNTTIGGVSTSYLHDGQNPVALNGTMFLEGPGLDEVYGKLASTGATSYLRDALGSTVAVSNSSATTTSSYAYSSYGSTAITGTADSPFQYTGRENDAGTNLYYYRARYYSPQVGRFISEDPIGLNGGINTYAYAWGNPISYTDPLGLRPLTATEKCKLKPYIPQTDLDNADPHDGQVPWYLGKDFAGITRGNDIYFRPGVYDGTTAAGLGILGHELVHVGQYRNGMNWLTYLWSTRNGYMNSPYEKAAYALENTIVNDLTNNPGGGSCGCQQQ